MYYIPLLFSRGYFIPAKIVAPGLSGLWPFPLKNKVLGNKMPYMKETNPDVYDIPKSSWILPNLSLIDFSSFFLKKLKNLPMFLLAGLLPLPSVRVTPTFFLDIYKIGRG